MKTLRAGVQTMSKARDIADSAATINVLDGVTATPAEINILDGVTSTTAELNLLDGVTATTAELNHVDGVTSSVQTQLDGKATYPSQTGNSGKFLTTDGSTASWGAVSAGVGALTDGSAVSTAGESGIPTRSSIAVDYDTAISTADSDFFVGVDGQAMSPYNEDAGARARGFGGVRWSNYWQRWFATTLDYQGGIIANNCRLVQSVDGVNWTDVGRLSVLGGTDIDKHQLDDMYRPNFCFDDSNGRLFVAGYSNASPYNLTLGYVDLESDRTGTEITSSSVSGANAQGHVCDWKWVEPLQQIIGTWYNRTGYFNTFSIAAGSTSITLPHTNVSHSSGSNKRMQIYWTQTAASNYKFYIQNDSTQYWYLEGSAFSGSLSSGTRNDQWSEGYQGDMSASVLVQPTGTAIRYLSTANDDWKTTTNWATASLPTNSGLNFCKYDPVKDDWIGWDNKGFVLRSTNGTTWTIVGKCGEQHSSKGHIDRKTTGDYGY